MGKGISPVIASIILILIVITLSSSYLVFTGRLSQETQGQVEEQASETRRLATTQFSISGVNDQSVEIRNIGSQILEANSLRVTLDDTPVNYTMEGSIDPGDTGTLTIHSLWRFGVGEHKIRVAGAAVSDSVTVRIDPVSEGRVLDMRFEEGTGTAANDFSGNENNGVLGGGNAIRVPAWTVGKFGDALRFDGVDDHVRIEDAYSLDPRSGEWSVAAWINPTAVTNGMMAIAHKGTGLSPAEPHWDFAVRGDVAGDPLEGEVVAAVAVDQFRSTGSIIAGTWTFVEWTKDSSNNFKFYINGADAGLSTVTNGAPGSLDTTAPLRIGATGNPADGIGNVFSGIVDEILIHNHVYVPDQLYILKKV